MRLTYVVGELEEAAIWYEIFREAYILVNDIEGMLRFCGHCVKCSMKELWQTTQP